LKLSDDEAERTSISLRPNGYSIGTWTGRSGIQIAQWKSIQIQRRPIISSLRFTLRSVTATSAGLLAAHIEDRSGIIVGE